MFIIVVTVVIAMGAIVTSPDMNLLYLNSYLLSSIKTSIISSTTSIIKAVTITAFILIIIIIIGAIVVMVMPMPIPIAMLVITRIG